MMKPISVSTCMKCLLVAVALTHASAAHAILVTGGQFTSLPPFPDLTPGGTESDMPPLNSPTPFQGTPIVFQEVGNELVPGGGIDVDHDGSEVVATVVTSGGVVSDSLKETTISGGSFASYMFHFDPKYTTGAIFPFAYYVTTIVFDTKILGIQLFSDADILSKYDTNNVLQPYTGTLEQGDLIAGLTGATYPSGVGFRGLDEDSFQLAVSGNTVMIAGSVSAGEIDQIRFIVAAVPELASAATWGGISLVAAGFISSRRRKFA